VRNLEAILGCKMNMDTEPADDVDLESIKDVIRLLNLALDDCHKILEEARQGRPRADSQDRSNEGS